MLRLHRGLPAVASLVLSACGGGGDGGSTPTAVPASVTVVAGDAQIVRYGVAVPTPPSVNVKDANGRAIAGTEVVFSVASGGGSVTGASVRTNASGIATVGSWTLGPQPGPNTLRATAGDVSATITANAIAGAATTIAVQAGDAQTGAANSPLPVDPAVLVTDGAFPVASARVTFAVAQGGGSVTPTTVFTDAQGIAAVGAWTLGPAGPQQLTATVAGLAPVTFSATAIASTVTSVVAVAGDGVSGFANNFTPTLPVVEVRNQSGAGVAGVPVTFAVTGGGGTASFTSATSGSDGRASPGAWRFGGLGPQTMTATVAGLPPVTFTATAGAVPASQFNLQVVFLDPQPTDAQKSAFLAARDRWQSVIVGDVPDYALGIPANACGSGTPAVSGPIDDVVIFASIDSIDGPSKILAQAGPCFGRTSSSITVAGIVIFDRADLGTLGSLAGGLSDVAFHEFGHVLGFGTNWPDVGIIISPGSDAVAFTGAAGKQAYAALLNPAAPPPSFNVPVENTGGVGTRDGHWRESVFDREIMTGFYDSNGLNPFSAVSAASMRDLGYVVNDTATDPFVLPLVLGGFRAGTAGGVAFGESIAPWPVPLVDDQGRVVRYLRR